MAELKKTKYINADKLIADIEQRKNHYADMYVPRTKRRKYLTATDCMEIINNQPSVSVVEVPRARWGRSPFLKDLFICTNCSCVAPHYNDMGTIKYWHDLNYCPHCGARMDGQEAKR